MKRNIPIEIRQVANGFIVTPVQTRMEYSTQYVSDDDTHVFDGHTAMSVWIREHFERKQEEPSE